MIRNINDRGASGSEAGRRGLRSLSTSVLLGVALSAFIVLGWLPGKAAFLAGFGPALAEFKPPAEDLHSLANATTRDPVAAILSHWEYTGECGAGGPTGCPASCAASCPVETADATCVTACCLAVSPSDPACGGPPSCWGCCAGCH